ncbi:hypothetical protein RJ641_011569 [Dillenia turbinata]|uniref:Uncharacterized protein n=1 Tax=Dillenia turbinata TaxID=194707 RepID=A0AAN8Z5H4_9MAGN
MADDTKPHHIGMLPWSAFSHMIPFLELASLIAQKGHKISFLSTNLNIKHLPKPPPSLQIEFISLSHPQVEGLTENAEATTDLPINKVDYLKMAYDGLEEPLARFLETSKPDWIPHDYFSHWVSPIATKLEHYTVPPKWISFPTNVSFRPCEVKRLRKSASGKVGGVSELFRLVQSVRRCDALTIRGCCLFQPEWLKLLEDMHIKPVIPVGQITPTLTSLFTDARKVSEVTEMENWLEKHKKGSIVYVAFGSEAKLTQLKINEIAHRLEKSGLPFFWVLRKHRGPHDEVLELPEGFEERVRGRGVVYTTWVPQLRILILEEKRMRCPIPRDEFDGSFTSDSVAESLRLVMVEGGKVYRDKTRVCLGIGSCKTSAWMILLGS